MSVEWTWPGARWWRFDFHTHTPASEDFLHGVDAVTRAAVTPETWLRAYRTAGLDCVAVTDHNSGAWIDSLKEALASLRGADAADFGGMHLFPGVEISVNGGVHILAVFGPEKTTSDIDSLLGAVGFHGNRGASDDCTRESPSKVIETIHAHGGLAIPAHADGPKGLFRVLSGTSLAQVLDTLGILAMEICDPENVKPQLYLDRHLAWTEVLGSDSHNMRGDHAPGSAFTWVKMGKPTLDGLRLALLDGPLSIRRSDQFADDPNAHGHLTIESLSVVDARYVGRGGEYKTRFNPWLNSIIGGRGTGKSTLLELLRIVLRRESEIPPGLKPDLGKYSNAPQSRADEGLLTKDARLSVVYRKDGGWFLVQWSFDGSVPPISEYKGEEGWQPVHGDVAQRFPARIYSQKQIFELAKRPEALLTIVDEAPEVDYRGWRERWDELESRFLSLRAQAREIETALKEESRLKGELDDVKRKLLVFEQAGHADVLKEYQRRQRQLRSIEQWETSWTEGGEQLRLVAEQVLPNELEQTLLEGSDAVDIQCLKDVAAVEGQLRGVAERLAALASEIEILASKWKDQKASSAWMGRMQEAADRYKELREKLAAEGAGDPSAYGQLVQQRQVLEERLRALNSRNKQLRDLELQAKAALDALSDHRKRLTELRKSFLGRVLAGNPYVSINVLSYGAADSVEEALRGLLNRSQGGFDKDIGVPLGEEGYLADLYKGFPYSGQQQIRLFEERLDRLKSHVVSAYHGENFGVRDRRFASHVQSLPPENLDRLATWYPEDSLEVLYSVNQGRDMKPVSQGSPGQRTAALLAFLLSYGNEPLVLDQPEDDLDNHLIYDLIVTQLRAIKQGRQVIVVTHNANIVVNGDSELVVALDVRKGQTRTICEGSLQESAVRAEICRVMEGGEKAFDLRYRRIKAGVSHV